MTVNDAAGNPKDAVQVTGTASTPTIFIRLGNLMGCGNCDVINVQASAVAATGGLVDLAINLDNTGSMAGAKITNAKIGANALVNALLPTSWFLHNTHHYGAFPRVLSHQARLLGPAAAWILTTIRLVEA